MFTTYLNPHLYRLPKLTPIYPPTLTKQIGYLEITEPYRFRPKFDTETACIGRNLLLNLLLMTPSIMTPIHDISPCLDNQLVLELETGIDAPEFVQWHP